MKKPVTNFAASVRARLLRDTNLRKGDFQHTLQRYAAERFLYRLGISPHRERFVLKGAMLFVLWDALILRPTRDLDLAGYWANDADSLAAAFRDIASIPHPQDGIQFVVAGLQVSPIRSAGEYHGFRLLVDAVLAGAVTPFQVDVGFGDAVVPVPLDVVFPVLLDAEAPHIRAYPQEAVLAEKLHAMVTHGEANTRYKDFFNVWTLSSRFAFRGETLAAAIHATFSRRKTAFFPWPVALSPAFYANPNRSNQWTHYLKRTRLTSVPREFTALGERVIAFLSPPLLAQDDPTSLVTKSWPPGGPWL